MKMVHLLCALAAVQLLVHAAGYTSRGLMSSPCHGMSRGVMTSADCHGAVLIGDFLSWDSADYKLSEALSNLEIVQEVLLLQLDEVAVDLDLFRLQMRNFDPDTVMVSIRTKAFEYMAQEVQRVIQTETRLGHRVAVLFFHLQAQGIPAGQRAFANAVVTRADGSQHYDKFAERVGALLEPAPLYVDEWNTIAAVDDLVSNGFIPE